VSPDEGKERNTPLGDTEEIMSQEALSRDIGELRREVASFEGDLKKSTKVWTFGGGLLVVFVLSYLTWAYVQVKTFIQPENVATIIDGLVIDQASPLIKEMSNGLIAMAPEVIDQGKEQAINFIPLVRTELESSLTDMTRDFTMDMGAIVSTSLTDVLADKKNKPLVVKASASSKAAEDVIKLVGTKVVNQVDATLKKETGEGLAKKISESQKQLEAIRNKLNRLQKGQNLNAEEKLERHFLQLVLADTVMVEPGQPAKDVKGKKEPAKKEAAKPAKKGKK
jgi:hypothetical protein